MESKESNLFDLGKIAEAEEQGAQDEREAAECVRRVGDAIAFLKAAESKGRATKARLKDTLAEAQRCLTENRLHDNETVRREVWKALISFVIGSQLSSYDEAISLVSQLVADGLLVEDESGPLTILGRNFRVPAEAMFEEEDIAGVAAILEEFRNRARDAFIGKASSNPRDLLLQNGGDFKVHIPPEKRIIAGTDRWFPGGLLLLRSAGGFIEPIDAIGGIANGVYLARCLGVKLEAKSLYESEPPNIAFDANDKKEADKNAKKQLIWHLAKRGLRFDLWLRRTQAQANLDSKGFFLETRSGKYFFDFPGTWEEGEGKIKISRLVFLIERLSQEGQNFIRIVSMPDYLKDILPKVGESYPEGERFSGIPRPLQRMLCAIHGKVMSAASKDDFLVQKVVESIK